MVLNKKNILILGASGYIGRHLFKRLGIGRAVATFNKNPINDAVKFDSLNMSIADLKIDDREISHAIILIGETNIDTCAGNEKKSNDLNVGSIIALIEDLKSEGVIPVFISTDNVFDGTRGSYSETDLPNPIVVYGRQKLEIENYLRSQCKDFCIVRLSKVYGLAPGDGTLFTTWMKALFAGEYIRVATDQVFSPISIDDVVEGLIALVKRSAHGIFHLSGLRIASRANFMDLMLNHLDSKINFESQIKRCMMRDFNLLETRPLNVSLSSKRFVMETGLHPKNVEYLLPKIVDNFIKSQQYFTSS